MPPGWRWPAFGDIGAVSHHGYVRRMSFDFSLTPRVEEWRDRITEFVDEVVIPREQEAFTKGVDDDLRTDLQRQAKTAGLRAPDGDVRSCFAMTEPPPGAGSDPAGRTRSRWPGACRGRCSALRLPATGWRSR
jgi:alkylation response protein AidB-like acyl-CoA dehydrogenase